VPDPDGAAQSLRARSGRPAGASCRARRIDLGDDGRFLVAVAGDASELDDEIAAFNWAIATTFVGLAAVLC